MFEKVAQGSFYDQLVFERTANGWTQLDEYYDGPSEVTWTYEGGLEGLNGVLDHTRLMETYESFSEGRHVAYWLGEAIESAVEVGDVIHFHYEPVDYGGDCSECSDPTDCQCDMLVGWVLVVYHVKASEM